MMELKPVLLSLSLGLVIGIIYSLSGVRSPAPPVIALVGLLGILGGEHLANKVKSEFFAQKDTEIHLSDAASDMNKAKTD